MIEFKTIFNLIKVYLYTNINHNLEVLGEEHEFTPCNDIINGIEEPNLGDIKLIIDKFIEEIELIL